MDAPCSELACAERLDKLSPLPRLVGGGVDLFRNFSAIGLSNLFMHSLAQMEIPTEVVRSLPADFVKQHRILPLALQDGTIEIATAEWETGRSSRTYVC